MYQTAYTADGQMVILNNQQQQYNVPQSNGIPPGMHPVHVQPIQQGAAHHAVSAPAPAASNPTLSSAVSNPTVPVSAGASIPMQSPAEPSTEKGLKIGNVLVGSVSNLEEVRTAVHHHTAEEIADAEDEKKASEDDGPKVPFLKLFHYATFLDYILLFIGVVCSIGNGLGLPIFTLLLKDLVNDGFGGSAGLSASTVISTALKFLYLSLGLLASGTVANACLLLTAARQGAAIRQAYLRCILRQDIAWFDTTKTGEITTSIERDCANVQGAIGEKIAIFVQNMATFIGGIVIGFSQGWQEALVLMGALPIIAGAGGWMAKNLAEFSQMGERAYRTAGGVAEQAISGIRTVASLCGENREKERYALSLNKALEMGLKKARANGIGFGIVMGSFFGTYALGLWFGSWLIMNDVNNTTTGKVFSGGDVIMIFFSVVMASFYLGQVGPAVQAFNKGQASARRIYDVVDRVPVIDTHSDQGAKPAKVRGDISFRNIKFTYPARPDAQIFEDLNLDIKAGTTVALVGSSGSGKSTIIQLTMRFYDPLGGAVSLDGVDLRTINVKWLRQHVGLVSQEPVLFAASIIKNIRYGKEDATQDEVEAACRMSNAHAFIDALPSKYETLCGQRGAQLSGGQKQRIAIARAIIADPKILLLDEATSALDTESEKLVQAALDSVMAGRTVVVVAHRLSTIRNADNIVVFRRGVVIEQGRHDDLILKPEGSYAELVSKQMSSPDPAAAAQQAAGNGLVKTSSKTDVAAEEVIAAPTKGADKVVEEVVEGKKKGKGYVGRAFALNKPEFNWAVIGMLGAIMNGALFPVLATLLVEMLAAYFLCLKATVDLSYNGIRMPTTTWINSSPTIVQSFYDSPAGCSAPFETNGGTIDCVWTNTSQWKGGYTQCNNAEIFCVDFYPGSGALKLYKTPESCYVNMRITIRNYCLGFVGLAVAAVVANLSQLYSFGMMGENLTKRLRQLTFASILRQDIGFFDMEDNSVGALTTKLAKDASYVEGAVGTTLGLMIQNATLMIISLVIAFIRGWMLTLLCLATFPVMIVAQYFQMQFIAGAGGESNKAYSQAGAVASESIAAIRTVAAFAAEDKVEALFHTALNQDSAGVKRAAFVAGLGQGFSLFTMFFLYFCGFAGGGYFMTTQGYSFKDVMQVFFSVTFMGIGAGQAAALAPDIGKAAPAMDSIFSLIDKQPPIDIESDAGERPSEVRGDIELRAVEFTYPARKDAKIFDGLNLVIEAGQTVALVGSSGSGKSTIVGLVQRFYDPQGGSVLLDGRDLRSLNLRWLRRQLGLVSQEPILFATTIAENIRYGKDGASNEEVEAAAAQANAHSFVATLPNGYNTMCGERGTQLSGGQKQRIAIARAIIADPRILLLDEATSALDSQSEVVVQAALDALMAGRTVLVVAHRLSTIRNANRIVVFRKGRVVEEGRHDDLIAAAGAYSELVSGQMGH